jgi:hypothetical protein
MLTGRAPGRSSSPRISTSVCGLSYYWGLIRMILRCRDPASDHPDAGSMPHPYHGAAPAFYPAPTALLRSAQRLIAQYDLRSAG